MQFQITLTSNKGYRPISTIIEAKDAADFLQNIREYRLRAVTRMLAQRHWTDADRVKYGYTTLKQRVYDPARFEQEKADRYERIKQERGWAKPADPERDEEA